MSQDTRYQNAHPGKRNLTVEETNRHERIKCSHLCRRTSNLVMGLPIHPDDPLQYLLPDSDEEGVVCVTEVLVKDRGSKPQFVRVEVGGVPQDGVVDTGADIMIVGAESFKRIATVAKLQRQDFKQPDKTPLYHSTC